MPDDGFRSISFTPLVSVPPPLMPALLARWTCGSGLATIDITESQNYVSHTGAPLSPSRTPTTVRTHFTALSLLVLANNAMPPSSFRLQCKPHRHPTRASGDQSADTARA